MSHFIGIAGRILLALLQLLFVLMMPVVGGIILFGIAYGLWSDGWREGASAALNHPEQFERAPAPATQWTQKGKQ